MAFTLFSCSFINTQVHSQVECQDIVLPLTSQGMATLTPEALLAVSEGSEDFSFSIDQDSFNCSDSGVHSVILTSTNNEGMQSTCMSLVTVVDKDAPEVEVENIVVHLSEMGTVIPDLTTCITSLTDNCSSEFTYRFSHTGFTTNHLGFNEAKIEVSDESGNQTTKQFVVQVLPPLADSENDSNLPDTNADMYEESFDFYPNPATEVITVSFDGNPMGMIQILDSTGKEVLSIESEELKTQIEINELPSGMYFIEYNSKVKRFIKK